MGYITLSVLLITGLCMILGALLGLLRGRNRSILRLILVLVSTVLSVLLKNSIVDSVMNFNFQGQSIKDLITNALTNAEVSIPESIQSILFTLVEIMISIIVFFALFFVLKFITWAILFPVLKIFIRRGKKKHALIGASIGLLQGIIVAFVICAPLTGLLVQTDKISQIKYQDDYLLAIPEDIGISEYVNSPTAKVYSFTGGWFFNTISSKKDSNGNTVSISDTCDIVTTVVSIADTFSSISGDMQTITSENVTPQEQVDTIKKVGDSLISIGNSIDGLNDDSKAVVQELIDGVKEMVSGEDGTLPPEVENALNNLNVDNLKLDSAGEAMNGIATYIEKTSDEFDNSEPVTQEDIDSIVNGLADNTFLIDVIVGENEAPQIIEVDEENKSKFETSINASTLTEEDKETLRQMFGLNK